MNIKDFEILVIGAGAWGTAIAKVLAENFFYKTVYLYTTNNEILNSINTKHINIKYFPNTILPPNLKAIISLKDIVNKNNVAIFIVTPSQTVESISSDLASLFNEEKKYQIACLSKGLIYRKGNILTLNQVIEEVLPQFNNQVTLISGPSFAYEVIEKKQTFLCIGSYKNDNISFFSELLKNSYIHCVGTNDVIGVGLSGALKNPIAIAAGITASLPNTGDNFIGVLIAEGLKEILEFSKLFNINQNTVLGPAGLGDLITTSISDLSRNRRFGKEIVKNLYNPNFLEKIQFFFLPQYTLLKKLNQSGYLIEGGYALKPILQYANKHNLNLPLFQAVYEILINKKEPQIIIEVLKSPTNYKDILNLSKPLKLKKEFLPFKGKVFCNIISEQTYLKIINNEDILDNIAKFTPQVIENLYKRTQKTKKSIKEKLYINNYIELFKQLKENYNNEKVIRTLCNNYAKEVADDFSVKVYKTLKPIVLLLFKYLQKKLNFNLHITGDIERIKKVSKTNTIVYTAMHKSNLDGPLIGLSLADLKLPPVRYAMGINLLTSLPKLIFFKKLGAYTVDREEKNNVIYLEVLKNYSKFLIENGIDSLIFVEGTRSRTGKINNLKYGLLKTSIEAYFSKNKKYGIKIVPIAISYTKVPEDELFCGAKNYLKTKDYINSLKGNNVYISFGDIIDIEEVIDKKNPVEALGQLILNDWYRNVKVLPNQLIAKILTQNNFIISKDNLKVNIQKTIKNNLITKDIDKILNEGLKELIEQGFIKEEGENIIILNEALIKYYGNMVP